MFSFSNQYVSCLFESEFFGVLKLKSEVQCEVLSWTTAIKNLCYQGYRILLCRRNSIYFRGRENGKIPTITGNILYFISHPQYHISMRCYLIKFVQLLNFLIRVNFTVFSLTSKHCAFWLPSPPVFCFDPKICQDGLVSI